MENITLKKYFEKFNDFPFLLITTSYDDIRYFVLMEKAIARGTPLKPEEIAEAFKGDYDLVEKTIQVGNEEPKQDKKTWDGIGDYLKEKNK